MGNRWRSQSVRLKYNIIKAIAKSSIRLLCAGCQGWRVLAWATARRPTIHWHLVGSTTLNTRSARTVLERLAPT